MFSESVLKLSKCLQKVFGSCQNVCRKCFEVVKMFAESVPVGTDLQRWERFSARLNIEASRPAYLDKLVLPRP